MFHGYSLLLPTVSSLHSRVQQLKPTLAYTVLLANAIIAGVDCRFGALETRQDLMLAGASHPQFKLRWLNNDAMAVLLDAMQSMLYDPPETPAVTVTEVDNFFCVYDTATHDSVSSELDQYLPT